MEVEVKMEVEKEVVVLMLEEVVVNVSDGGRRYR